MGEVTGYWLTKFVFQRGLALVYLIAFLVALNQFRPLLGQKGLLPVQLFVKQAQFHQAPSVFFFFPKDSAFTIAAGFGILLSLLAFASISEWYGSWFSALTWGLLWILYLSFVNVGQTFYSFGWESLLLESGFFAIFLGGMHTNPSIVMIVILRWILFRIMFGAGLIKLRGDPCWRDLTCLYYHYETQPMPNPLSWYFHWLPQWIHRGGVLFNHFVELIVPFGYFAPQPISLAAGLLTIFFHGWLTISGNFSWLGFLTIILAIPTLNDRLLSRFIPLSPPALNPFNLFQEYGTIAVAALVGLLSLYPISNMLSSRQVMNASSNPFHLVNTYGAFGSITHPRHEVIVEGTSEEALTAQTRWREYEFKGRPGDVKRSPPQVAPYHMRLDWLMWFEALNAAAGSRFHNPWFVNFMAKLLQGDNQVLRLIRENPFPDKPPRYVRALLYVYRFTTPAERRQTSNWWSRELVSAYFPPISLDDPEFRKVLEAQWWLSK